MDTALLQENKEQISSIVHNAWWKEKMAQGFHPPLHCAKAIDGTSDLPEEADPKFTKRCDKCHSDMYPFEELPENVKDYDRVTVQAIIDAAKEI